MPIHLETQGRKDSAWWTKFLETGLCPQCLAVPPMKGERTVTCPACDGIGEIRCPDCGGDGSSYEDKFDPNSGHYTVDKACPTCQIEE